MAIIISVISFKNTGSKISFIKQRAIIMKEHANSQLGWILEEEGMEFLSLSEDIWKGRIGDRVTKILLYT